MLKKSINFKQFFSCKNRPMIPNTDLNKTSYLRSALNAVYNIPLFMNN